MSSHIDIILSHNQNATGEVLVDLSANGRVRPWREKRMAAEQVASAYAVLDRPGPADRCQNCGTVLVFSECAQGHKRLARANFCKQRLCPMCAWRRSIRWTHEVYDVLHAASHEHPRWGYVLLTLTVRNVAGDGLPGEIGRVLRAWDALRRRREFRAVAGWLRVLEITHNDRTDTWHPHLHVLLAVKPDYWSRNYVSHERWVSAWRDVLELDYDPIVDVRKVRARGNDQLGDAAREVGKYAVKDSDLIGVGGADTVGRVEVLDRALRRRRLIAWGGALKLIAQQLEQEQEGSEDLVNVSGEDHGPQCPVCGSGMVDHVYGWISSVRQYIG
jgi:plasmid rolling circle replication initiator protein Rep